MFVKKFRPQIAGDYHAMTLPFTADAMLLTALFIGPLAAWTTASSALDIRTSNRRIFLILNILPVMNTADKIKDATDKITIAPIKRFVNIFNPLLFKINFFYL